ncbi:Oidioi.mRNA.OKI2018_I69.XSR.g14081.t1.cds [Oikopleura dioica]|uniref:Oidioi.mRNA.OKI2018_I69.XSR.g14081.t1.cds n=1 Tax=Oikopleura dioica TaxID=34765 RepID=A0ABN7SDM5_OIKDI|nr:Oidioi.mRNA.OKI2018_I69.XSR.g14081.t1.cds [Oikopleura dioica]
MDRQINNNTMAGMSRNTSRVLAPPGGRSNIFFGEDPPAPKTTAAAPKKVEVAPLLSAGGVATSAVQAAVKTADSATNTEAYDESASSFARNKSKNTVSQITF